MARQALILRIGYLSIKNDNIWETLKTKLHVMHVTENVFFDLSKCNLISNNFKNSLKLVTIQNEAF